ncbi:MAG: ABC transporter ATP-binding protein, partial [Rothia mucilaginosa]|nr:ABC transporter ATP-binding protein [Rothia mucilaginosa]
MDIRHTITRFGATALIGCGLAVTAIPATFAQNGEESVTHVYSDKATSHISEVWYKGETLKITGEGFLTQDGTSGSTIAIKLNKGSVKIDGKDYLEVQADEKGNFSVSIPWQDDLNERISVDVYLLSGSLKDNDTARGGKAAP